MYFEKINTVKIKIFKIKTFKIFFDFYLNIFLKKKFLF